MILHVLRLKVMKTNKLLFPFFIEQVRIFSGVLKYLTEFFFESYPGHTLTDNQPGIDQQGCVQYICSSHFCVKEKENTGFNLF